MRKLFRADLYQFLKNKILWAELAICAVLSLFIIFTNYSSENQAGANALKLEDIFFTFYQMVAVIIAAGISLIVGTQYSDGTIRNKLVVGHKRSDIYFSTLAVCVISSFAVMVIHAVLSCAAGFFLFGKFTVPLSQIIVSLIYVMLDVMVLTAIFAAAAMNISNKAFACVAAMLSVLLITYLSGVFVNILTEPEMTYSGVTISIDGGVQLGDMIKNPAYVSGTRRTAVEFLADMFPIGQIIQICDGDFARSDRWPIISGVLFIVISSLGFWKFNKQDIK